jgi:hypothetical protein
VRVYFMLSVIVSDPDQSITKGSRFKYEQKTLAFQLINEFIQNDCYDLLYDFVEKMDGNYVIILLTI